MTAPVPVSAGSFRVLHVCTGNICRSPMAEHLMRGGLQQRFGAQADRFVVESAGTWGRTGDPMEEHALTTLETYTLTGQDFRARGLLVDHVVNADLVLVATREHRAAVVTLHPRAAARTFTLREFARLVSVVAAEDLPDGDIVERAQALVRAAAARRGTIRPDEPGDDDLGDPFQAAAPVFAACAALIELALLGPLNLLALGRVVA